MSQDSQHQNQAAFVRETAEAYGVPGAVVAVWSRGQEVYASHGITDIDAPEPVDEQTVFTLGSVSKTYAATALMRLVAEGRVELDAPVRRYVPEFTLADERAADEITVRNLLNHTAGFDWRLSADTGEGDDALALYVADMAKSELIAPPGTRASYSQLGYNLLGRVIEKVTGLTYEEAVAELLLEPIGLTRTTFATREKLTHRSANGHNLAEDGTLSTAKQWKDSRANNAGGAAAASAQDLIRWAAFHLGDGTAADGTRVLPADALHLMREQTVELPGSSIGDALGLCWFLRDIEGIATIGHGGSANGQFAELLIVPEHDFAVVSLSNAGPDSGLAFNQAALRWALEHYLGVVEKDPEPLPFDAERAAEVVGDYENEMMTVTMATDGTSLSIACAIKPELRAAADTELPPDLPAAAFGLLPGDGDADGHGDAFIVTEGGLQGHRGSFTRDASGTIIGADLGGRFFTRMPAGR
ncbi:serine hydrolase domain-containing protein [Streptomyces sp. NPDC048604]|uniref:serine hydrolase domain-containing protein n=1 Tax=Streptomyces sp. NPDC048604 TaxID=3365578 RepID=UPI00371432D9